MKKYLLIIACLIGYLTYGQAPIVDGTGYTEADTAKKTALVAFNSSKRWLVYDTDTDRFEYWDGDSWEVIGGGSFTPTDLLTDYGFTDNSANWDAAFGFGDHSAQGYLTGLSGSSLWQLGDVVQTSPLDLDILSYEQSSGNWINRDFSELGLLTSADLSNYMTLSTVQTITGSKTFDNNSITFNTTAGGSAGIKFTRAGTEVFKIQPENSGPGFVNLIASDGIDIYSTNGERIEINNAQSGWNVSQINDFGSGYSFVTKDWVIAQGYSTVLGDLSESDIDTFSELDAIVADESLANLDDAQTLTNKTIAFGSNTLTNVMSLNTPQIISADKNFDRYLQMNSNWGIRLGNTGTGPGSSISTLFAGTGQTELRLHDGDFTITDDGATDRFIFERTTGLLQLSGVKTSTGTGLNIFKDDGTLIGVSTFQLYDPLTRETPLKWVGTQAQYNIDFPSGHGSREIWITDAAPILVSIDTGTTVDLSGVAQDNFGAASSASVYTLENIIDGGYAEVFINASTEPTVTGATKFPNTATFIADTDMILCIKDFNGTRKFWFVEF